ncbi:MAG: hypothetical protein M1821_002020 [Bathelium mastoideum]|nr:MAG: hypothetical protein M1821_002020 [Bathelium mastoideum]
MAMASCPHPAWYQLFFLYIEPVSTVVGAYYAHLQPNTYLALTHSASAPPITAGLLPPLGTKIVLSQLANLYLAFALNEALVLRSTYDIRVWRTLLLGLLIADFGHLYSVSPLGSSIYWQPQRWNAIDWGNLGFVYVGALTRISFLLGLGMKRRGAKQKR